MRWMNLFVVYSVVGLGCGPAEEHEPEVGGPYRVAIEVDYLDIYGPIVLDVQGNDRVFVEDLSEFDCETTPLVVEGSSFALEANSERFFFWKDAPQVIEGDCLRVSLTLGEIDSGIVVFFENDQRRKPCFPLEILMTIEGREASLGSITRAWDGVQEDLMLPEQLADLARRVRVGEAVMAGGGSSEGYFEDRSLPPERCEGRTIGGPFPTPIKDMVLFFGGHVRDW